MDFEEKEKMNIEKILNLLHMSRRAGHLVLGFDACKRSCLAGKCNLLILAEDLAEKKKAEAKDIAEACNVKWIELGAKSIFGQAFKTRDLGIISVEDKNFAKGILSKTDFHSKNSAKSA
jgi:ribosomal protein L7Ae-like RNA K-turn-binding protein